MRHAILFLGLAVLGGCATAPVPRLRATAGLAGRAGVYVTAAEFEAGQVADAITCQSDTRPVGRDAFSGTAVVNVPGGSRAVPYAKAAIFGFRACDGTDVRFVRGASFRVVRAPPLYLYEREYRVQAGSRNSRLVVEHGFSATGADSVRSLTKDALKRAYPGNHRFHDLLDLAFRSDDELIQYDEFHHEYRVARLLREAAAMLP